LLTKIYGFNLAKGKRTKVRESATRTWRSKRLLGHETCKIIRRSTRGVLVQEVVKAKGLHTPPKIIS
jgi:hypothetical protein